LPPGLTLLRGSPTNIALLLAFGLSNVPRIVSCGSTFLGTPDPSGLDKSKKLSTLSPKPETDDFKLEAVAVDTNPNNGIF
jgi:hypothetical protein